MKEDDGFYINPVIPSLGTTAWTFKPKRFECSANINSIADAAIANKLYSKLTTDAAHHISTVEEFVDDLRTEIESKTKRKPISYSHIPITTNDDESKLSMKTAIIYEHFFNKYSSKSITGKLGISSRVVNSVIRAYL